MFVEIIERVFFLTIRKLNKGALTSVLLAAFACTYSLDAASAPCTMHRDELSGNRVTSALYNKLHYGSYSGVSERETAIVASALLSGYARAAKNSATCASRSTSFDRQLCIISYVGQGNPY